MRRHLLDTVRRIARLVGRPHGRALVPGWPRAHRPPSAGVLLVPLPVLVLDIMVIAALPSVPSHPLPPNSATAGREPSDTKTRLSHTRLML